MPEPTLLCVDDEPGVLNSLRRMLRKEPYRVLTACSGEQALSMLEQEFAQVVLSDYRMPGISGTAFLGKVRQRYPDTVRVVLSGFADAPVIVESINEGEIYRFIPKPWIDDELKAILRQCFQRYDLMRENERLLRKVRVQNEVLKQLNENLERSVAERTRSLQLSQEILEKLPFPVFGVGCDGTIVLVNAAVSSVLPPNLPVPLGMSMQVVLPLDVADAVQRCLNAKSATTLDEYFFNEQPYRIHVSPLDDGDAMRGCVLALETLRYDAVSISPNQ